MSNKKAYHGGAFFNSIGVDFSTLEKKDEIINADVLDAWFDPSPHVIKKLQEFTAFAIKTSPPTQCEGLITTIAKKRRIDKSNIIVNGGSSDIMFSIFPRMLTSQSKVLILDPMYGEYSHIFKHIIESTLFRHELKKENQFIVNTQALRTDIEEKLPDMVVLVNPNSPTGEYCDKNNILELIKEFKNIQFVVDETYIEYVNSNLSMEKEACQLKNLIIIKSMSKVYALSGTRVAYMVAHKNIIDKLATFIPPWSVSLPGQIAGIEALNDEKYYEKKYEETHELRNSFVKELSNIEGIEIYDSIGNFFLIELKNKKYSAKNIVNKLREKNIFIRNCDSMSTQFNDNFLRIAVKERIKNDVMIRELKLLLQ